MDTSLLISLGLVFVGGFLALVCCIINLAFPSKKGQALFDLFSWPTHGAKHTHRPALKT